MPEEIKIIGEEQELDFKKWILIIRSNWILIIAFVTVAVFIAYIFNKTTVPQYEVHASILVKPKTDPLAFSPNITGNFLNEYIIKNEIAILNSSTLLKKTISNLPQFRLEYYKTGGSYDKDITFNSPFSVVVDTMHQQIIGTKFNISFLNDTLYEIHIESENQALYDYRSESIVGNISDFELNDTIEVGSFFSTEYCRFVVLPSKNFSMATKRDKNYAFRCLSPQMLQQIYSGFEVANNSNSSVLNVKTKLPNPKKGVLFLNELCDQYLYRGIEKENLMASITIDFIDKQLIEIVDSLNSSEDQLEEFKTKHKVLNLDFQAEQVFQKLDELQAEKSKLLVKRRYLQYLKENLNKEENEIKDLVIPSTLEITDPVLNKLVLDIIELQKERTDITLNSKKSNPYILSLNERISKIESQLLETIDNINDVTQLSIENIDKRIFNVESQIQKLPQNQRQLFNIERRFRLNDELYTYLLQKRSEMQIQKASNLPNNEILDYATTDNAFQVHPNTSRNYFIALLLGSFLPILLLVIFRAFNEHIQSNEELEGLSPYPIIGSIFLDNTPNQLKKDAAGQIMESFRTLRANLKFCLNEEESAVIMVSSAIPSEGKSYISLNLASTYSLFGKKVCLLDFDLRRAKLASYLNIKRETGVSTYLNGDNNLDKTLVSTELGFDFMPSGPIPPNPSVLIASEYTFRLIEILKAKYDIIILDTPPLGVISDSLYLSNLSDLFLFIVRHNVAPKPILKHLFEEFEKRNLKNVNLLVNAVPSKRKGYGYGYGYAYGYGYGYNKYIKKQKKNIFRRLLIR